MIRNADIQNGEQQEEETYLQPEHARISTYEETVRLVQQYLQDIGFKEIASDLAKATGVDMEDQSITQFRNQIMSSSLDLSILEFTDKLVHSGVLSTQNKNKVEFLIFEQRYIELLEQGCTFEAIKVLQKDLRMRANTQEEPRLYELAQLIILQKPQNTPQITRQQHLETEVNGQISTQFRKHISWWKGSEAEGRAELLEKIQELLEPKYLLPQHRLETLLQQSLSYQLQSCKFHNTSSDKISLLKDHQCYLEGIPSNCQLTIQRHKDQVWLTQFSQSNSNRFATFSKDGLLCIFTITSSEEVIQDIEIHTHQEAVCLNWSNQSDQYVVVATKDMCAYIYSTIDGQLHHKISGHANTLQSALFSADDSHLYTLGVDQKLMVTKVNQKELSSQVINVKCYEDMVLAANQALVLAGKSFLELRFMNTIVQEGVKFDLGDQITAITGSRCGLYLLANLSMQKPRIELYKIANLKTCVQKFEGHKQANYILRPQFGGYKENLVLCGSEDHMIYMWRRQGGELIKRIQGHCQIVNSVTWSPERNIFITGSDDTTVKIWSTNDSQLRLGTQKPIKIQLIGFKYGRPKIRAAGGSQSDEDSESESRAAMYLDNDYISNPSDNDMSVDGGDDIEEGWGQLPQ